ncbi:MAG TPA: hypothetical protein DDW27_01410 [Bacteroidales bacterium]|nr:hypothetical protein [Bacteroidales bacterium]
MRTITRIAWFSAVIGVICLILAAVSLIMNTSVIAIDSVNFFRAANSFFLLTIALFIFVDLKLRRRRITYN